MILDKHPPPAGNDFIAIATGENHSLALKSDGTIVAWGDNTYGQTTLPPGNDFIAIAAYGNNSIALKQTDSGCLFHIEGDFNDDCKVDILDLSVFASNWLLNCNQNPDDPACAYK